MQLEDFKPFEKATDILVVGKVGNECALKMGGDIKDLGLTLVEIMHHEKKFALLILATAETFLQEKPELRLDPVEA